MIRIAYICADMGIPVFGEKGASIHIQEVIRALINEGAYVDLFAVRFDADKFIPLEKTADSIQCSLPYKADGDSIPPLAHIVREPLPLTGFINSGNLTVHTLPPFPKGEELPLDEYADNANRNLYSVLEKSGYFNFIYERYSLWSYAGMEYAKVKKIPGILEVNSLLIEEQAKYRRLINIDYAEFVAKKVFDLSTAVIAVSSEVAGYLERYVKKEKVYVIPNGINPLYFSENIKPALPSESGVFTIGFVGTLKPWHGLSDLVEIYSMFYNEYPNTRLLVVGDGPKKEEFINDLRKRNLFNTVYMRGVCPHEEIPGLLASMDTAIAPYPKDCNFYFSPLKVYEYMAAGLPAVVSNAGQLSELIVDGVNGLLCEPGDYSSFVKALNSLYLDDALCKRIGTAARETVREKFTWQKNVRKILEIAGKV